MAQPKEQYLEPRFTKAARAHTAEAGSIEVPDPGRFRAEDVVYVPRTQEYLHVREVGTELQVARGFADSSVEGIEEGDDLLIVAFTEGSSRTVVEP